MPIPTPYSNPDVSAWFYMGWPGIARIVLVGIVAYVALVALLRITGKRTLAKMNAFDLVVSVAIGSTLASTLLSKDVAILDGLTAFTTLVLLQYVVAWTSSRSKAIDDLVKSEPTILVWQGELLEDAMLGERLSKEEVMAAIRASGRATYGDVTAVVLETNGELSVIGGTLGEHKSTLDDVSSKPGDSGD